MEKGTLIEFRVQGERRFAVIDRTEGKKHLVVIDEQRQSHIIHPRQIEYQIPGGSYQSEDIARFRQAVQPYLDPSNLEVAWEIVDGETVTISDMAQILFSRQGPEFCYAAYYLLSEDKLYFKQKNDRYEPRSPAMVTEIKHQLQVTQQRLQAEQEFLARLRSRLEGQDTPWLETDKQRLIPLEKFVLQPETPNRPAQELLSSLNRPANPEGAWQLLVELGHWRIHENLFLRRSQILTQFDPNVLAMADDYLRDPPPDVDRRLDLTHLRTYTIDDESTEEIDDGLSVETLEDGRQRLWIHIADPTRLLRPGDDLDLEARRRSTTVYLPTGMIPMFPPALATGPMSLRQGCVCAALSFGVILAPDGSVQEYMICPSLIKPTYRLTYEDTDEMLELGAEQEIETIAHWANVRQQWRISQGAISIHLPEAVIKVKENDEVFISLLEDTRSRQLVAEMMILGGQVAGHYGQIHNLPLPFRSQPQPDFPPEEELLQLPAGPVRDCALRRCMPKSEMTTTPARHASLALNAYVQVTSPIRRYTDLLAHFQIKAHLRGDPLPFDENQLQQMIQVVSASAYEATLVERQTNRYWGLEFLRRQGEQPWQALVLRWLREQENMGLILLEELGLELAMRFQRQIRLGEQLTVQVSHADPRQDIIHFRELTPAESANRD